MKRKIAGLFALLLTVATAVTGCSGRITLDGTAEAASVNGVSIPLSEVNFYLRYQQAQMQSMIPEKTEKPEKAEKKEKSRSGGKETRESRKMRREVEKRIGALEKRLEELDGEMEECGSDHVRLAALYEEKEETENQLLELYEKQEELALLAEE